MKKTLILMVALTALSSVTKAQVQFSFGPGLGLNYTVHSSNGSDETYSNLGPLFTSQFDMQFSRHFGVLLWLDLYSDMSYNFDNEYDDKFAINYFEFSPTLKYCVSGSRFYLYVGPGVGIKTIGRTESSEEDYNEDIPDMLPRLDFRFGAGYEFFLSKKLTLSPFIHYNAGLNKVISYGDWRIDVLQFGVVLRFSAY